ncbi:MAG: hypothetical protein ACJ8DI_09325 [Ktedonobacteraceae bacterium]
MSNPSMSNPSKASGATIRAFELISVGLWALTAVLIATVFANQHDYWFLLLSWTFVFPFSAFADEYALLLRYDPGFRMLFWRTPVMIPFAFGWFFTLPLILVWQTGVLSQLSLGGQAAIMFAVSVVWSVFVEYTGTRQKLWVYHWTHGWKLGEMPWAIPVIDAVVYVLAFLLHGVVVQLTSGMGWVSALVISYLIYAGMFVAFAFFNWVMITRVFGVRPTPA